MSTEWKDVQCGIIDWATSKLPDLDARTQFIWADQNIAQPVYPYLVFKRDSIVGTGSTNETRSSTDLSQPLGEEVALETISVEEFTLSIDARVDEASGSNDPDCDAMAILETLRRSLSQNSTTEMLCLAGLAVVEDLPVINLSEVVNAKFISRATIDIRLRVTFTSVEKTGYIDAVRIISVPCNPSTPSDVTGVDITVGGP